MDPQYQEQQRPGARPRSRSAFSFISQISDKSGGSKSKVLDRVESPEEKKRRTFQGNTKANPNSAIREAQPSTRAQIELLTLQPIRSIQHTDWQTGALITDPDASNPSRSRLERPLDTIRSFEAAADGGYSKRNQPSRTESEDGFGVRSRRSSLFLGYEGFPNRKNSRINGDLDEPNRQSPFPRPNSEYHRGPPNSYPRRGIGPRMSSAPVFPRQRQQQHESTPWNNYVHQQDQYDTAESSGSHSEPWTASTNPSSENSSVDRINAYKQSEPTGDAYGGNHGRRSASPFNYPIAEENWQNYQPRRNSGSRDLYYPDDARHHNHPPPPRQAPHNQAPANNTPQTPETQNAIANLRQAQSQMRAPPPPTPQQIRQNSSDQMTPQRPAPGNRQASQMQQAEPKRQRLEKALPKNPTVPEKKKSWLKRRFSRS